MDLSNIVTLDKWIIAYLILKVLDFATGFAKAGLVEGWQSCKLRKGVLFVFVEFGCFIFAGTMDQLLNLQILLLSTKMLFVYKECLSIIENLDKLGVKLPKIFSEKINSLNPDSEEKDKEE